MRNKHTTFRWTTVLCVLALVATACGNGDTADTQAEEVATTRAETGSDTVAPAEEAVEISIWFGREDFQPTDAFASFHEAYPNITVKTDVIPLEQATENFIRQHRTGNAPDIVQVPFEGATPLYAQGVLLDISDIKATWQEEDPESFDDLLPAAWGVAEWDGVPHGLATSLASIWFSYRVDLFEEAGIPHPPATYDDVLEAGRVLSEQGERGDLIGFAFPGARTGTPMDRFVNMFLAAGGEMDENNTPQLTSPGGVYVLEFLQTLMRDQIADEATLAWETGDSRAAYFGGRAAMAQVGMNIMSSIQETLDYGTQWEVVPHPVRPGAEDQATHGFRAFPYYVNSDTEHPYEVGLVLRYLADPVNQAEIGLRYQSPASRSVLSDPAFLEQQPWLAKLAPLLETMGTMPFHERQPEVHEVLFDAIQEALANPDADATEIASRYQQRLDALNE